MKASAVVGKEFINIYTEENPILNKKDICYFLFTNNVDYHRPLIAKGLIVDDKFDSGMNKEYIIQILEILENQQTINEFVIGKQFNLNIFKKGATAYNKHIVHILPNFDYENYVITIQAFFIRNSEEKIIALRNFYVNTMKKDIIKQLKDIELMLM